MNKVISILVAVLLCIPCFNSIAADGGIGNVYLKRELSPSPGFQYKEYYATNNNGKQLSHTFTLVPGEQTSVSLGYADSLYGRQTATETVCYGESTGKNVVAAVNGNSFSLQSGVPNGTAISEGKLLTYENSSNSIGVKNDNTIVYGINDIKISIEHKGENLIASKVNKWAAQGSGLYIFSADYAKSTKTTGSRIEAVIRPNKAANLSTNAKITCTVISSKATYNSEIPKGCFVLSASTSSQEAEMLYAMKSGDTVTINCTATKWANVDFAIGTDKVIVSDGKYLNGAATKNDSELAARTAVGITQNGNLLFFLCNSDGKYGKGLTTEQTAKEMISLGVKYACFLSGGQYTTAALGQEVINFPSSGKEVPLGCTVMFTNTNKDPAPTTLKITPESPTVFTNGFVRLSISAADSMGNTKNDSLSNLKLSLSQPLGVVSGTLFKAGGTKGNVTITATATVNGKEISGSCVISIIDAIDDIRTSKKTVFVPVGGRALINILGVRSGVDVHMNGYAFKWSVSNVEPVQKPGAVIACKYGYLDNSMVFHASPNYTSGSFKLNATFGYSTVSVNVVIGKPDRVISSFDNNNTPFSTQFNMNTNDTYMYTQGKYQTVGMRFAGKVLEYNNPIPLEFDSKSLSLWCKGNAKKPYAVIESVSGTRINIPYHCTKDYALFNGWKQYSLTLPDDAGRIISPFADTETTDNIIDEITVSYGSSAAPFNDISKSWAKQEISLLYDLDISTGYGIKGELKYKPENNITRAEFAKMIVTFYGLDTKKYSNVKLNFRDVNDIPSWAIPYVKAACAEGIINGSSNPDGSLDFLPNSKLTRAQAATIIGRKLMLPQAEIKFTDKKDIPQYAMEGLGKAINANILSGYPDGSFKPGNFLTRAEVAKIISNLYKYTYEK